ncbi:tetratricopeptide repeat protein [Saccharicrinis sp. FJH54]|uniref:tetratricopeptide repeat protein n=1 Tax=Saccharicrinis sp. FJH54 TaxID=3344665 RepID=UPI0035D4643D
MATDTDTNNADNTPERSKLDEILKAAEQCMQDKDFLKATELYEQALDVDGNTSDTHKPAGLAYYSLYNSVKDQKKQKEYLQKAIFHYEAYTKTTVDADRFTDLGNCYYHLGLLEDNSQKRENFDKALENYDKNIRLNSNASWAYFNKALVFVELSKLEADQTFKANHLSVAVKSNEKGISVVGYDALKLANNIELQLRLAEYESEQKAELVKKAESDFNLILINSKNSGQILNSVAQRLQTGSENFQTSEHKLIILNLAKTASMAAIETDAKDTLFLNQLGLIFFALSEISKEEQRSYLEKAYKTFRRVIKADKNRADSYINIAKYYERLASSEPDRTRKTEYLQHAASYFDEACLKNGGKPETLNDKGNVYFELSKYVPDTQKEQTLCDAIDIYAQIIKKDKTYVYSYFNSGLCFFRLSLLYSEPDKKRNHLQNAIVHYTNASAVSPDYTLAKTEKAQRLLDLALYTEINESVSLINEALKIYTDLSSLKPEHATYLINKGECYMRLAPLADKSNMEVTLKKGIEQFRKSLDTKEKSLDGLYYWGMNIQYLSYRDDEVKAFEEFAKQNHSARGFWELGNMFYYSLKDNEKAVGAFRMALSHLLHESITDFPNIKSYILFDLGNAMVNLNRFEEGIQCFEEALNAFDGDYIYAFHNIAHYTGRMGKHKEANEKWYQTMQMYRKQLNNDFNFSDQAINWYYLGSLYNEIDKDFDRAEEMFAKSAMRDLNNTAMLKDWNALLHEKNRKLLKPDLSLHWKIKKNINEAERISRVKLCNEDTFFDLAFMHFSDEQYQKAEACVRKALAINPESTGNLNLLGLICINNHSFADAVEHFKSALKLDAYNMDIRNNLATVYIKQKEFDKAENEYKSIIKTDFYNVDAHIGLGDVFLIQAEERESDQDLFELSEMHFRKAISYGKSKQGSRRLGVHEPQNGNKRLYKDLDLADIYYSLGYLKIKLFEKKSFLEKSVDRYLLNEAYRYFNKALKSNPEHYKAARARAKVREKITVGHKDHLIDKFGPWLVSGLAFFIFVFAQLHFYFPETLSNPEPEYYTLNESSLNYLTTVQPVDSVSRNKLSSLAAVHFSDKNRLIQEISSILKNHKISVDQLESINTIKPTYSDKGNKLTTGHYILISFSTLLLIIAGLYLPQLLKLKIGSIELEKNVASETTGITSFKISTPHTK